MFFREENEANFKGTIQSYHLLLRQTEHSEQFSGVFFHASHLLFEAKLRGASAQDPLRLHFCRAHQSTGGPWPPSL